MEGLLVEADIMQYQKIGLGFSQKVVGHCFRRSAGLSDNSPTASRPKLTQSKG